MDDISPYILPDGTIDDSRILRKEEISKQKNVGRLSLTRFWAATPDGERSYIFKPCKDQSPIEFELWFQSQILTKMSEVRAPKLLAHSIDEDREIYWMIYEDIGRIEPSFAPEVRIRAAEKLVKWHSLPRDTVPSDFKSFMPYIDDAMKELVENRDLYETLLEDLGIPHDEVSAFFERLITMNGTFPSEQVICHGDYHCLNLLETNEDLVILDWEFIQINSVYWDFYTLLDMATPRYRIQIHEGLRKAALNAYVEERSHTGWTAGDDFIYGYHLYSLIYSAGILRLLMEDIRHERFDLDTLHVQKRELSSIIHDCFAVIGGEPLQQPE